MATIKSITKLGQIVFLVILLIILKTQSVFAQIGQTEEFIVKNPIVPDKITTTDCPKFTYILDKPTTEDRSILTQYISNDSFERFNASEDFVKPMIKIGLQTNFRYSFFII